MSGYYGIIDDITIGQHFEDGRYTVNAMATDHLEKARIEHGTYKAPTKDAIQDCQAYYSRAMQKAKKAGLVKRDGRAWAWTSEGMTRWAEGA